MRKLVIIGGVLLLLLTGIVLITLWQTDILFKTSASPATPVIDLTKPITDFSATPKYLVAKGGSFSEDGTCLLLDIGDAVSVNRRLPDGSFERVIDVACENYAMYPKATSSGGGIAFEIKMLQVPWVSTSPLYEISFGDAMFPTIPTVKRSVILIFDSYTTDPTLYWAGEGDAKLTRYTYQNNEWIKSETTVNTPDDIEISRLAIVCDDAIYRRSTPAGDWTLLSVKLPSGAATLMHDGNTILSYLIVRVVRVFQWNGTTYEEKIVAEQLATDGVAISTTANSNLLAISFPTTPPSVTLYEVASDSSDLFKVPVKTWSLAEAVGAWSTEMIHVRRWATVNVLAGFRNESAEFGVCLRAE